MIIGAWPSQAWLQSAKKKDIQEGSTGIVALVAHGFMAPVEAKAPTGCAALWPKPKDSPKWVPKGQIQDETRAFDAFGEAFIEFI